MNHAISATFGDFKCMSCKNYVSADMRFSGVNSRNHCPYCLWSKHLDLNRAGDRLSACKGAMRPVGLTLKRSGKKYGGEAQGELMLIHQCVECGKISINRIAADDIAENVWQVYESFLRMEARALKLLRQSLGQSSVNALDMGERELVYARLFGKAAGFPIKWLSGNQVI
jgi:hypothetical protein